MTQYEPGSDEDYIDGGYVDEEDAREKIPRPTQADATPRPDSVRPPAASAQRRVRIKPMSPALAQKYPNVVTILLTRDDGRQVLLVRGA
jgi:hypothetical protein